MFLVLFDHADTKYQRFLMSKNRKQQTAYAESINTTLSSLRVNYVRPNEQAKPGHYEYNRPCHCQPNSQRMLELAKATKGACNYEDMIDHFYRA